MAPLPERSGQRLQNSEGRTAGVVGATNDAGDLNPTAIRSRFGKKQRVMKRPGDRSVRMIE